MALTPLAWVQAAGVMPHNGIYRGEGVESMSGKSMLPLMRGQSEAIYGPDKPVGTFIFPLFLWRIQAAAQNAAIGNTSTTNYRR